MWSESGDRGKVKAINGLVAARQPQAASENCACKHLHRWCEYTGTQN